MGVPTGRRHRRGGRRVDGVQRAQKSDLGRGSHTGGSPQPMRITPRARCWRAGAGSSATALQANRRSIDCMILGSERCDWIRRDAQVGCLVCALPRDHTKIAREQGAKLQRPRSRRAKRTPRPHHGPVGPRYDCDRATGQKPHKNLGGSPPLRKAAAPASSAPRRHGELPAAPTPSRKHPHALA